MLLVGDNIINRNLNHTKRQNDFVRGILSETLNREEALETFELLDKDKDGNLTVKEIATLFGDDIKGEYNNDQ